MAGAEHGVSTRPMTYPGGAVVVKEFPGVVFFQVAFMSRICSKVNLGGPKASGGGGAADKVVVADGGGIYDICLHSV